MKNGLFKIAIVAALVLFLGIGTSMAGTWTQTTTTKVLTGAHQSNFTAVPAAVASVFTTATGEGLAINDTITINLTGGATFNGGLTLQCTAPANVNLGAGDGIASPPLSGGTAGSTSATWRLLSAAATGSALTFNSNAAAGIFNVTNVGSTGTVDLTINMLTSTGTQIGTPNKALSTAGATTANTYLFLGKYGITVDDGSVAGLKTDTADVRALTGPYTKFLNNAVMGTANKLQLTNNSDGTSVPLNKDVDAKKALVTLVGDFSGISKITGTGITGSSSTGSTTGALPGEFLINAEKTAAYAVNTAAFGPINGVLADIAPTFYINGTTTQNARVFTVQVQTLEQGTVWLPYIYLGPKTFYTIARNGVSFVANSIGPLNNIKISDKSGNQPALGGKVNVVAWDSAGVQLPNAAGVLDILLKSNETIELTGAVLAARFVGTPMKYEVSIESTSAMISNVKNTPAGFGSTVYTNGANGAL